MTGCDRGYVVGIAWTVLWASHDQCRGPHWLCCGLICHHRGGVVSTKLVMSHKNISGYSLSGLFCAYISHVMSTTLVLSWGTQISSPHEPCREN